MTEAPFRRIVTGHNSEGKAIILEDSPPPRVQRIGGGTGPMFYEVWNTTATPAPIDPASGEPPEDKIVLAPPANGTRIRVLDIPPDDASFETMSAEERIAHFEEIGAGDAVADGGNSERHAHMHKTETIDYGIVLSGEIVLIMDEGETLCKAGDIIIQRGTNHGWANRSDQDCRIAFILIDGKFSPELA
ncbi:MAG: cupin domain-containing protein [Acidimicrobiales bacterium]|nr:cupin domain-containing protein [Hyphomonadaceae bacterium]RZV44092.1 MAG: cupin domain-containing protein [Acidimicrobiales bacterium]